MQNSSRPQPLTFSHVNRPDETWSSDSDSGITVDSHSPPSKTTPDSGIGAEQLSWNLPPPPPSLLSDDEADCGMSAKRASTTRAGLPVSSPEQSEAERQRQQDYVRSTLLQYERQKMLEEEEQGRAFYGRGATRDAGPTRCCPPPAYPAQVRDSDYAQQQQQDLNSSNVANDYVPCQMVQKLRHHPGDVSEGDHITYHDLGERLPAGDFYPPGDDGYGTDSRSTTTGSLASPLSSSLSSLTTDSSSSLNGSQRGVGMLVGGAGAVRAQPVAGGGRLVIGKRGMLVKRRDLPPVERTDTVTLEDRLRALTTIQEEDSATASSNPASSPGSQKREASHGKVTDRPARSDPGGCDLGSRSGSDGAASRDGQAYPEGLYTVISKRPDQLSVANSSRPAATRPRAEGGSDRSRVNNGDVSSSLTHRAVPVTVHARGEDYLPSQRSGRGGDLSEPSSGSGGAAKRKNSDPDAKSGSEGRTEVRFKAGGGGVKLNQSGQFEIDYSYYMKASPSESNDEINTYSPTSVRAQFGEAFREGGAMPPRRRSTPRTQKAEFPPEDSGYPRWNDVSHYPGKDLSEDAAHFEGPDSFAENATYDPNYAADTEHVYMNVERYDHVQGSAPNLSTPSRPRRHSGDVITAPEPRPDEGGPLHSILRRNPAPGSGYPARSRSRAGHGDRNSCDVGSLYRQTDLSHTFPPPSQGVAADRLSINLGDLPRIQEQLRATSEMLLSSSGKRHQFASSSDIYKLFQGQQNPNNSGGGAGAGGGGFAQGRQPPHRRSFHDFTTTSSSSPRNLAEVRSRVRAGASSSGARSAADQSQADASSSPGFSPRLPRSQGPLRADHTISVPADTVGLVRRGSGREAATGRHVQGPEAGAPPGGGGRDAVTLRERLDKGQQFSTDIIQGEEGEQLSTLV